MKSETKPTTPDLGELERLAGEATPGDLNTAEHHTGADLFECPVCDGQGDIPGDVYNNIDGVALGVQFFGVGTEFGKYEAFFRAANPETVLALIAELRRKEARIRELEAGLEPFVRACDRVDHPSWDDDDPVSFTEEGWTELTVTFGDFRQARALLTETGR